VRFVRCDSWCGVNFVAMSEEDATNGPNLSHNRPTGTPVGTTRVRTPAPLRRREAGRLLESHEGFEGVRLARTSRQTKKEDYFSFFSSFLGWHCSQTLPASAAFTQHSCLHFFPASTVASQQGFFSCFSCPRTRLVVASMAKAQSTAVTNFVVFMFCFVCLCP
jgi:hypothetical protein